MTTKYYCDICGEEVKSELHDALTIVATHSVDNKFDICDNCLSSKPIPEIVSHLRHRIGPPKPSFQSLVFKAYRYFELQDK